MVKVSEVGKPARARLALNGALTEHFEDLKSFYIGSKIRIPHYTPAVDFLDHDLL